MSDSFSRFCFIGIIFFFSFHFYCIAPNVFFLFIKIAHHFIGFKVSQLCVHNHFTLCVRLNYHPIRIIYVDTCQKVLRLVDCNMLNSRPKSNSFAPLNGIDVVQKLHFDASKLASVALQKYYKNFMNVN